MSKIVAINRQQTPDDFCVLDNSSDTSLAKKEKGYSFLESYFEIQLENKLRGLEGTFRITHPS